MPRALTEQEKCIQCQRLLDKGKMVVLSQGIKKVSVDDIAKAAGMAKGTFYQHFESKESYLYELIWHLHRQLFKKAEQMIISSADVKANTRNLITSLFHMQEIAFFIQNEHEISMVFESIPNQELQSAKHMEKDMFEKLLALAGIDTKKVRPGVVHNYIHTLFLIKGSDLMTEEDLPETFNQIMESLIAYIFGGIV